MDETFIIMIKDLKTGFLEKELGKFDTPYGGQLRNIFAYEQDGEYLVCMQLTTGKDISDDHFNSVYDYYNEDNFNGLVTEFFEIDDCDNPSWEISVPFIDNETEMQQLLQNIMFKHIVELDRVYKLIKNEED